MPVPKSSRKTPQTPQPSEAEKRARARVLKGNPELAEQFGINQGDYVREVVKVSELPTPPATESMLAAQPSRKQTSQGINIDQAVMQIFQDEAEEIRTRLERYGIAFPPHLQQDLVDHLFSLLALNQQGILTGGGALARR